MRYTEAAKLLDFFCKFMGRLSWDINHLKTKNPRKTRGGTAVSWKLTILPVPSNAVNRVHCFKSKSFGFRVGRASAGPQRRGDTAS